MLRCLLACAAPKNSFCAPKRNGIWPARASRSRCFHNSSTVCEESVRQKSKKEPTLQDALRKFYLKVHPDLFSQHPEQKAVNEKSFQHLMSILDDFKGVDSGNQTRSAAASPGVLTFYFRKQTAKSSAPSTQQKSDTPSDDDDDVPEETPKENIEFGKADVFIRLPDPSASLESRERLLASQLASLFSACGVEFNVNNAAFGLGKGKSWEAEVSLLHFLTKISERCRELAQIRKQKEQQMDIERTVFYVQHRLRILTNFPPEINQDWKMRNQTEKHLLSCLESTLKALADTKFDMERLHNLVVVFGTKRGIDLLGRLNLHIEDPTKAWLESLKTADPEQLLRIRESGRHRSELEKVLATRLGFAYFYSDYSVASSPAYMQYIDSIIAAFDKAQPPWVFRGMADIKLRVVGLALDSPESISSEVPSCTVSVPIGTNPIILFKYIKDNGTQLVRDFKAAAHLAEAQHLVILKLKRKYQLVSLHVDPLLRFEQIEACCRRLMNHAPSLGNMLQGQRIYIGTEFDVKLDDGTICIKWNWLL